MIAHTLVVDMLVLLSGASPDDMHAPMHAQRH
jgi:hypothetical protein